MAGCIRHCVVYHGMTPANTQGTSTKKIAEPKMALLRCIAWPLDAILKE